jgi:hypothetical protein
MRIAGSYDLAAPAERIWPLIFDPAELLQLIPGCEQIEQVSPGEYRGRLNLRIAAVGGTFQTYLKIIDQQPPSYTRFRGEAAGPGGVITGEAVFGLAPQFNSSANETPPWTTLTYEGLAQITGPLGSLNSRLVEGVAQALIRQGLDKLNMRLQELPASSELPQIDQIAAHGSVWRRLINWIKSFMTRLRRSPQVI